MAKLVALSPAHGLVPVAVEGAELTERHPEAITSIAPLKGKTGAVGTALAKSGLGFPEANQSLASETSRILSTGPGQAMLLGPPLAPDGAAVTDQSDAWCVLALEGPLARAVLARLTPLDLRPAVFGEGAAARTLLGHMTASITRTGPDTYEIMIFRSMAATAVHELADAMKTTAAQA